MTYKNDDKSTQDSIIKNRGRAYATEADRLAAEEAERKAEKELFDKMMAPVEKRRHLRLKLRMKQSLFFFGFTLAGYVVAIIVLASLDTDMPFVNVSLIIYASIYLVAFLIYFLLARGQD